MPREADTERTKGVGSGRKVVPKVPVSKGSEDDGLMKSCRTIAVRGFLRRREMRLFWLPLRLVALSGSPLGGWSGGELGFRVHSNDSVELTAGRAPLGGAVMS